MAEFAKSRETICFKDIANDMINMTLEKSFAKSTCFHMHDTFDYGIIVQNTSNCYHDGHYQFDTYIYNTKHKDFVDKNDTVQGYRCLLGPRCNERCAWKWACNCIHWWIKPKGNVGSYITKIYQFESTIWEVTLRISYKNKQKRVTLS